jgi:hypothetical protein
MNRTMVMAVGIVGTLLCGLALGQPTPVSPQAVNPPAGIPESAQKLEDTVLPDFSTGPMELDAVIGDLRQKVAGFNVVIVRSDGVPGDFPQLPSMQMKNVTVGQFLQFLKTSFPGLDTLRIDGPNGPMYVIRINSAPANPGFGFAPPGLTVNPVLPPGSPQNDQPHVKVYYLAEILSSLDPDGNRQQDALNDVATLISQALDEVEEKTPSEIKVHAGTRTLIFKGGKEKMAVLDQLLDTLTPKSDPEKKKLESELQQIQMRYKLEVESLNRRNQQAEEELAQAKSDLKSLREAWALRMNATTRP